MASLANAIPENAPPHASPCKSSSPPMDKNFIWREIKSIFDATSIMEHHLKPIINLEDQQWCDNSLLVRLRQLLVLDRLLLETEGHNNSRTLIALTDLLECHQILPTCSTLNSNKMARLNRFRGQHQQQWWDIRLDGQSTLFYCIKEGLFDVVALLLNRGANPNLCGKFFQTPLKAAFIQIEQTAKDFNDMRQFIERGGRGNIPANSPNNSGMPNFADHDDFSLIAPAHDAMVKERMRVMKKKLHELEQVVQNLIQAGAEMNFVHVIDYKKSDKEAAEHAASVAAHATSVSTVEDSNSDGTSTILAENPAMVRVILPTSYLALAVQSCSRHLINTMLTAGAELQPKHQPHFVHPFYTALKRGRWNVAYEMLRFHGLDPTIYDQSVIIVILQRVWSKSRSQLLCPSERWHAEMIPLYAFLCYYTLELADHYPNSTRELLRKDLLDYFIKNFIGPQTFDTEGANLLVYRSVPSLKWLARKAVNSKVLPKLTGFEEKPFAREYLCRHRLNCLSRLSSPSTEEEKCAVAVRLSHALVEYLHYGEYNAVFMLPNKP